MMLECVDVQSLLDRDPEFKTTHELYQDLLHGMKQRDSDSFFSSCHNVCDDISGFMEKTVRTLLENEPENCSTMA